MNLCECGCGKECHNRFIFGHNPCSEETRLKMSLARKGTNHHRNYWIKFYQNLINDYVKRRR
jgi:hypothetical protein